MSFLLTLTPHFISTKMENVSSKIYNSPPSIWKIYFWKRAKWKAVTLPELCYKSKLSCENPMKREIDSHFCEKGIFYLNSGNSGGFGWSLEPPSVLWEWLGENSVTFSLETLTQGGCLIENNPNGQLFRIWQERLRGPSRWGKLVTLGWGERLGTEAALIFISFSSGVEETF